MLERTYILFLVTRDMVQSMDKINSITIWNHYSGVRLCMLLEINRRVRVAFP